MSWVALYRRMASDTRVIVVSSKIHYRRLASALPRGSDAVLEIGCSTGAATRLLAARAGSLVAVDVSIELVQSLASQMKSAAHVKVLQLDARDTDAIKSFVRHPDLIFLDIGGDALLGNVCSLLRGLLIAFAPRRLVVRSFELAIVHRMIEDATAPAGPRSAEGPRTSQGGSALEALLALSRSFNAADRLFAARRLRSLSARAAKNRLAELATDPDARVRRVTQGSRNHRGDTHD